VLLDDGLQAKLIRRGYEQAGRFSWERTPRQALEILQGGGARQGVGGVAWIGCAARFGSQRRERFPTLFEARHPDVAADLVGVEE